MDDDGIHEDIPVEVPPEGLVVRSMPRVDLSKVKIYTEGGDGNEEVDVSVDDPADATTPEELLLEQV